MRGMYATVTWSIEASSINSATIKDKLEKAFGAAKMTSLRANVRIVKLRGSSSLGVLGKRLEGLHDEFPTEFDYICVGSEGGVPLAPANRATWDAAAVAAIIAPDV